MRCSCCWKTARASTTAPTDSTPASTSLVLAHHVTRHTSRVTRHASHLTRHTSRVTRHTSHVTRYPPPAISGNCDVSALLIRCGANVLCRNKLSVTPLHAAALAGHLAAVQLLISAGACVTSVAEGLTPLHMCARGGHYHLLSLLVKHGADVNAGSFCPPAVAATLSPFPPAQRHAPPLHPATAAPRHRCALSSDLTASFAVAAGYEGETPLHVAAESNCYRCLPHTLNTALDPPPTQTLHCCTVMSPVLSRLNSKTQTPQPATLTHLNPPHLTSGLVWRSWSLVHRPLPQTQGEGYRSRSLPPLLLAIALSVAACKSITPVPPSWHATRRCSSCCARLSPSCEVRRAR
jgi:hypothetical protein